MRKLSRFVLLIVTILTLGVLAACTNKDSVTIEEEPMPGKDNTLPDKEQPKEAEGKTTTIELWHTLSGEDQVAIESIVEGFNESQGDVKVQAEFQGSYEEAMEKWQRVSGTEEAPALIQVEDLDSKIMLDSDQSESIQPFVDRGEMDIEGLEPRILNTYKSQGELVSIPLEASIPMLVYNKKAFKEVGLNPENAPDLISGLIHSGESLTKGERVGFSMPADGWLFENWLSIIGGEYVNGNNGHTEDATKAIFNSDEGRLVFRTLHDMNDGGTFKNFGSDWEDVRDAFVSEETAMYLESSSEIEEMMSDAPFDVGVAYVPGGDELRRQGVVTSGSSMWVSKGVDEEQQEGTLAFLTYFLTPEVQAEWHVETGNLAINPKAYDEETVQAKWKDQTFYQVVLDQLHNAESAPVNQGALFSAHRESRQAIVDALEGMYEGKDYQKALAEAAERTNTAIEEWNSEED